MRAILWIGGIVIVGAVVFVVIPAFTVQNAGAATLVAIKGGDIKGTATLSPVQGGQATMIDVQVERLEPNTTYALSIRSGSCFGSILTALQPAVTDISGNGSSSTTLSAQIQTSWFIILHNGSSTRNAVLACGQVVVNAVVTGTTPPLINPDTTPIMNLTPTPGPPGQFPNTGGGPPQQP
ncbi:MAG TPA: hypothetical protein VH599_17595 [Ktedonobacterales bacterium]